MENINAACIIIIFSKMIESELTISLIIKKLEKIHLFNNFLKLNISDKNKDIHLFLFTHMLFKRLNISLKRICSLCITMIYLI